MGKVKLVAAIIVVALVLVVFLQNREPVRFEFLFFAPLEVPKTILILGSALCGAAATLLAEFFWRRRKRPGASAGSRAGLSA